MDIKQSINIALAKQGEKAPWLADKLGITRQALNQAMNNGSASSKRIEEMAKVFNMPVSEFIALGE